MAVPPRRLRDSTRCTVNPIAPTIALIGLALFKFGAPVAGTHWGIGGLTIVLIILFSQYMRRTHRAFELFPILKERIKQRAGTLSGGEQQMLSIARALMAEPDCFLMDEPSLGLAPLIVDEIFSVIEGLKAEGKTILLVEQNAKLAFDVADRAYVMETGRIMLSGTPRRLLHNDEVVRSFLGREYREKWEK